MQTSKVEKSIIDKHNVNQSAKFAVSIKENQDRLPKLYWLPKLHIKQCEARFITNLNSFTTTKLSTYLTFVLLLIKNTCS